MSRVDRGAATKHVAQRMSPEKVARLPQNTGRAPVLLSAPADDSLGQRPNSTRPRRPSQATSSSAAKERTRSQTLRIDKDLWKRYGSSPSPYTRLGIAPLAVHRVRTATQSESRRS